MFVDVPLRAGPAVGICLRSKHDRAESRSPQSRSTRVGCCQSRLRSSSRRTISVRAASPQEVTSLCTHVRTCSRAQGRKFRTHFTTICGSDVKVKRYALYGHVRWALCVVQLSRQQPDMSQEKTPSMASMASMANLGDYSKGGRESLSPGAGLATAEEQAEAAYADLMFTSMVGPEGTASEEEADSAWEECLDMASNDIRSDIGENSKSKGVVGDVLELFNGTLPPTQSDIDVSNNCIIAVNPHAVR
eukprot:4229414-Pyramimonas_sp.AAC.1